MRVAIVLVCIALQLAAICVPAAGVSEACVLPPVVPEGAAAASLGGAPVPEPLPCAPGERHVFDLRGRGSTGAPPPLDRGCMSLPVCPQSRSMPLFAVNFRPPGENNATEECGCGAAGGDLDLLVWGVEVCSVGEYCLPGGTCSQRPALTLVATTRTRTRLEVQVVAHRESYNASSSELSPDGFEVDGAGQTVTTTVAAEPDRKGLHLEWTAAGVPGQRQRLEFQHCLPYTLGPADLEDAVSARCGGGDRQAGNWSLPESGVTVALHNLSVDTTFQDGQLVVRGRLSTTGPVADAPHVKLASLVCSLGGERVCVAGDQSPQPFTEIHRRFFSPDTVSPPVNTAAFANISTARPGTLSRPFLIVHNLGVNFACESERYIVTCAAALHYSAKGRIVIGQGGCPLWDRRERAVAFAQTEASFTCTKNMFNLDRSRRDPVDPLYIFQYKGLQMSIGRKGLLEDPHLSGNVETENWATGVKKEILVNKTQLVARIRALVDQGAHSLAPSPALASIDAVAGTTLSKMDPVYVDIAMGQQTQGAHVRSAMVGHPEVVHRAMYGPVDIRLAGNRSQIPSTVFFAAGVHGWWSVLLSPAPVHHTFRDVLVLLDLVEGVDPGGSLNRFDLSRYDDVRVWTADNVLVDRSDLVAARDSQIYRERFDDPTSVLAPEPATVGGHNTSGWWSTLHRSLRAPPPSGNNAFVWFGSKTASIGPTTVQLPGISGLTFPTTSGGRGFTVSFWWMWLAPESADWSASRAREILVFSTPSGQLGEISVAHDELVDNALRIDVVLGEKWHRHLRTDVLAAQRLALAGFTEEQIRSSADGDTSSQGGLNKDDIKSVLKTNNVTTTGDESSSKLRARLATLLTDIDANNGGFFERQNEWIFLTLRVGASSTHVAGTSEISLFVDAKPVAYTLLEVLPVEVVNVDVQPFSEGIVDGTTRVRTIATWYAGGSRGFEPSALFGEALRSSRGTFWGGATETDHVFYEIWEVDALTDLEITLDEIAYLKNPEEIVEYEMSAEDATVGHSAFNKTTVNQESGNATAITIRATDIAAMGWPYVVNLKLRRPGDSPHRHKNITFQLSVSSGTLQKRSGGGGEDALLLNVSSDEYLANASVFTPAVAGSLQVGRLAGHVAGVDGSVPPSFDSGEALSLPEKTFDAKWWSQNGPRFTEVSAGNNTNDPSSLDLVGSSGSYVDTGEISSEGYQLSICMWAQADDLDAPNTLFSIYSVGSSDSSVGIRCKEMDWGTREKCSNGLCQKCAESTSARGEPTIVTLATPGRQFDTDGGGRRRNRSSPWPWRPFVRAAQPCPKGFEEINNSSVASFCRANVMHNHAGANAMRHGIPRTLSFNDCKLQARDFGPRVNAVEFETVSSAGVLPSKIRGPYTYSDLRDKLEDPLTGTFNCTSNAPSYTCSVSWVVWEELDDLEANSSSAEKWQALATEQVGLALVNDYNDGDTNPIVYRTDITPIDQAEHNESDVPLTSVHITTINDAPFTADPSNRVYKSVIIPARRSDYPDPPLWIPQRFGFSPTSTDGNLMNSVSTNLSGLACRDLCASDPNATAYGVYDSSREGNSCFCYTSDLDATVYSGISGVSVEKHPGSPLPIHSWKEAQLGFQGYARSDGNHVRNISGVLNSWSGECACVDGSAFAVGGLPFSTCADEPHALACVNGVQSQCNDTTDEYWPGSGWPTTKIVPMNVSDFIIYNSSFVEHNVAGVLDIWHGTCSCMDGAVYTVGGLPNSTCADHGNALACVHGVESQCNDTTPPGNDGYWPASGRNYTHTFIVPANASDYNNESNLVQNNVHGVLDIWGGKCTCLDGAKIDVGGLPNSTCADFGNALACVHGVESQCNDTTPPGNDGYWPASGRNYTHTFIVPANLSLYDIDNNIVEDVSGVLDMWGGKCTCVDGQVFDVGGLPNATCANYGKSLACVHGLESQCNDTTDIYWPGSGWATTKIIPANLSLYDTDSNVVEDVSGVLDTWGGKCTCVDGQKIDVGGLPNATCANYGKSLACVHGLESQCNDTTDIYWPGSGWATTKIVPANASDYDESNLVQNNVHGVVDIWGGKCTCLDGAKIDVGGLPNSTCADAGNALACVHGVESQCNDTTPPGNDGYWPASGRNYTYTFIPPLNVSDFFVYNSSFVEHNVAGVLDIWHGTCSCMDGAVYTVGGLPNSTCADHGNALACVHGVESQCNDTTPPGNDGYWPASGRNYTHTFIVPANASDYNNESNLVQNNVHGVLDIWGGTCTCLDGATNYVGGLPNATCADHGNALACVHGVESQCNDTTPPGNDGYWPASGRNYTHTFIVPANASDYNNESNLVQNNVHGVVDIWGGTCTCLDGATIDVGGLPNSTCADAGNALACVHGVESQCNDTTPPGNDGYWPASGRNYTHTFIVPANASDYDESNLVQNNVHGVVDIWGGKCTCLDGAKIDVGGLPNSTCADAGNALACVHGVESQCNDTTPPGNDGYWPASGRNYTYTFIPPLNVSDFFVYNSSFVEHNVAGVLDIWHGTCSCMDGAVYTVGGLPNSTCADHGNALACVHGVESQCNDTTPPGNDGYWPASGRNYTHTFIVPANASDYNNESNLVQNNVHGVLDIWGGTCTCLDGATNYVGGLPNATCADHGNALACVHGVESQCNDTTPPGNDGYWPASGRNYTRTFIVPANASDLVFNETDEKNVTQHGNNVLITYSENTTVLSTHGGFCTCPDGQVYSVAGVFDDDNTDECGRGLACEGGVPGVCGPDVAANWTRKKVVCGRSKTIHIPWPVSNGTKATCAETRSDQDGNNVLITYSENTTVLSNHGGLCTCPDGQVYSVAGVFDDDNTDECGRGLACEGGVSGVCGSGVAPDWTRKKVVCGRSKTIHIPWPTPNGTKATCNEKNATQHGNNVIVTYSGNTTLLSTAGGICRCPDGQSYAVAGRFGDSGEDAPCGGGLACHGGTVAQNCSADLSTLTNWTRKEVFCAQPKTIHIPWPVSNGTKATCAETRSDQDGNNVLITYSENTTVLSTHGGFCTCPDGFVYSVAGVFDDDNTDECGRGLACEGGVSGDCGPDVAANWTRKKVVCGRSKTIHIPWPVSNGTKATCAETRSDQDGNNVLITYSENTTVLSTHGGFCTCPDGQVYSVAGVFDDDNTDECGRGLACDGGVSGVCGSGVARDWTRKKVVCGRSKTIHVPWPVSNGTKATCAETRSDQAGNNVLITYSENTTALSNHGGFCTCPDGFVYSVAGVFDDDNTDECGRGLACEGGVPGVCGPDVAANWTRKKVVCGRSKTIHIPWPTPNGTKATCNEKNATQHGNNVIVTYSGNTTLLSTAGGICRCPDGQSYAVAGRFGDSGEDAPCGGGLACHGGTVAQNCSADLSTLTNWTRKEVFCAQPKTIHIPWPVSNGTKATCAETRSDQDGNNVLITYSENTTVLSTHGGFLHLPGWFRLFRGRRL